MSHRHLWPPANVIRMACEVTAERVKELERQIAELKSRWPPHSVPPQMLEQLEELEEALQEARRAEKGG